ncbi:L-rhamnose/proton symporter RhaT [Novosphingobium profundi]|uniref:L-rhamnose/proton symporter RhaT n=1 Tax=Novosphingobium profundi TaxID=1774954 RepID=UPI001BD92945|nr:L-rhamnose/proton symporter RhaT [Novosphingobium profundi]MBT0671678.1 L-rhamnose/proton symporter RhaT [Novosphingobium profundi]
MGPNPALGVIFHWIGGFASASFYVPYKRIKLWSWEIFWLAGGLFSWAIAPWLFASLRTENLLGVLSQTPTETLWWCWFWGALWGFGGLTFGLTMRYLGLSLGMAVALGITTVIGTLGPPIYHGTIGAVAASLSGQLTLLGILVTLVGIVVVAFAGHSKDAELGEAASEGVAEFNLRKGILIALFSGVMSGCFAWGLAAGEPIRQLTLAAGTDPLNQGLPVLCVVLAGGLTTNAIWCAWLIMRNKSFGQFFGAVADPAAIADAGAGSDPHTPSPVSQRAPLLVNYLLAALGGTLWYFQFFFYTMGESQMGRFGFSSWTLHMASIILFSTLWGFALKEWKGASTRTRTMVWAGIALLIGATGIIGLGNMLDSGGVVH